MSTSGNRRVDPPADRPPATGAGSLLDAARRAPGTAPDTAPDTTPDTTPDTAGTTEPAPPSAASTAVVANHTRRRRSPLRLAGIVIGLVGTAAGLWFAAVQSDRSGGAATPEAAARRLFVAVADGDALAIADALVPAEREALAEDGLPLVRELRRVGAVEGSTRTGGSGQGGTGRLDGLEVRRAPAPAGRGDLAAVTVQRGTFTTALDLGALPEDWLRAPDGRAIGRDEPGPTVVDLARTFTGRSLILQRHGGRWSVSLVRTLLALGGWDASVSDRVRARGADSPEDAVRSLLSELEQLDGAGVAARLDPGESGGLHDAGASFLPTIRRVVAEVEGQYDLGFPGLVVSTEADGDRAVVQVEQSGFTFSLTQPDSPPLHVDYGAGCATVQLADVEHERCGPDLPLVLADLGLPVDPDRLRGVASTGTRSEAKGLRVAFVAVREGGRWYVSPLRTLALTLVDELRTLRPDEYRARVQALGRILGASGGGWSTGTFLRL